MPKKLASGKGFRQGDILFRPTKRVTGAAMHPVDGRFTVALGEHTGHHHSIDATPNVAVYLDPNGMTVEGTGALVHQEHDPQAFTNETYEIVEQRRADPSDHRALRVSD
jgi:hypothetical protein